MCLALFAPLLAFPPSDYPGKLSAAFAGRFCVEVVTQA